MIAEGLDGLRAVFLSMGGKVNFDGRVIRGLAPSCKAVVDPLDDGSFFAGVSFAADWDKANVRMCSSMFEAVGFVVIGVRNEIACARTVCASRSVYEEENRRVPSRPAGEGEPRRRAA